MEQKQFAEEGLFSEKLPAIIRESKWLGFGVLSIFLFLILISYSPADPGWSHQAATSEIHNLGGRAGAWLADILLYLFGFGAYCLPILCACLIFRNFRHRDNTIDNETWWRLAGFFLMMISLTAFAALKMKGVFPNYPLGAGGILGGGIAKWCYNIIGSITSIVLFLLGIGIGFSLFTRLSWLDISERIGLGVERLGDKFKEAFSEYKDKRAGRLAVHQREQNLRSERAAGTMAAQQGMAQNYAQRSGAASMAFNRQPEASDRAADSFARSMEQAKDGEQSLEMDYRRDSGDDYDFDDRRLIQQYDDEDDIYTQERDFEPVDQRMGTRETMRKEKVEPGLDVDLDDDIDQQSEQFIEPTLVPQASPNLVARPLPPKRPAPKSSLPRGSMPTLDLLHTPQPQDPSITPESLEFTSRLIEQKLADFGVKVKVTAAYPGPVITRYEIEPDTGVKGAQIVSLMRDLARALCVVSIRIIETIPQKSCMGLEVPNPKRQMVALAEILGSDAYHEMKSPLTVAFGKDISGRPIVQDLAKMPHLLVAGTTGSGKSVGINAMILSLVYKSTPDQVRLILIDPKMLELSIYDGIPHLLAPVVTDMKQAANALTWCVAEMERRYRQLSSVGVRNLHGYNARIREATAAGEPLYNKYTSTPDAPEPLTEMPHIVIIIDELADLMMVAGKKIEELIARLAQKARAAGIHLILATQRPSVDVITGLIKANIPSRMAFQLPTKIDSKTILDQPGAEALLGQGDMLFLPPGTGYPVRVHGAFVDDDEVRNVADFLRQTGAPDYVEGILDTVSEGGEASAGGGDRDTESDPMYDEAVAIVLKTRRASISLVQRQLRIGYNRAARLIEQMEAAGIVSPMQHNGTREVLAPAGPGDR